MSKPGTNERLHLAALLAIAAAGLALRWYRLDLMSFRFDSAQTMFNVRSALKNGPPLTGIVNSLGFENPPGLSWLLLPAGLFTPRPDLVAAWFGLLTITALWPLHRLGRLLLPGFCWAIPCIAFACLPQYVMQGRNLWAQWLLPPLGAWFLYLAVEGAARLSSRWLATAIGILWVAALVHLAALLYVPFAAVGLYWLFRELRRPRLIRAAAVGSLPALLLIPSAIKALGPAEPKPDYVQKFESLMPEPKGVAGRLADGVGGQVEVFASRAITEGLPLPAYLAKLVMLPDLFLLILSLAGLVVGLLYIRRINYDKSRRYIILAGLVWLLVPAVVGSIVFSRVNATYFALAAPALLLLAGAGIAPLTVLARRGAILLVLLGAGLYGWFVVQFMHMVDQSRFVPGQYYIPLVQQREVVKELASRHVSAKRMWHLSGDWFGRSYAYLLEEELKVPVLTQRQGFAVLDDINLRQSQAARVGFIQQKADAVVGSVFIVYGISPDNSREFADQYFALPTAPTAPLTTFK